MASTVFGRTIVIEGEITGEEEMVVQGSVRGKITTRDDLHVDAGAVVEADLEGANVIIAGQVNGAVTASERLELASDGRLMGDVRAPRIMIADGASFKGNVDMEL